MWPLVFHPVSIDLKADIMVWMGLTIVLRMWVDLTAEIFGPNTPQRVATRMWRLRSSHSYYLTVITNRSLDLTDRGLSLWWSDKVTDRQISCQIWSFTDNCDRQSTFEKCLTTDNWLPTEFNWKVTDDYWLLTADYAFLVEGFFLYWRVSDTECRTHVCCWLNLGLGLRISVVKWDTKIRV